MSFAKNSLYTCSFCQHGQLFRSEWCSFVEEINTPFTRHITNTMARKKREKELQPNIKVRLDRRTVITVRDRAKLEFWKERYPQLEVLED